MGTNIPLPPIEKVGGGGGHMPALPPSPPPPPASYASDIYIYIYIYQDMSKKLKCITKFIIQALSWFPGG